MRDFLAKISGKLTKDIPWHLVQGHSVWKSKKKYHSEIWGLRSNSVTRQGNFDSTKIDKNANIEKLKCDIFGDFQTLCKGT